MKFHESHYDEYISKVEESNIHSELIEFKKRLPKDISQFRNLIIYGPSGSGKYSQTLHFIKHFSPSQLKYEKKMISQTEKGDYKYKISDVHYELDMALLGCNSKIIWHEVFGQIVDIVSMKKEKSGIIVCKNFHEIHSELLDIFYSYMQQYNHDNLAISLRFILITENVSFLPINIINHSYLVNVRRPNVDEYAKMGLSHEIEPQNIMNLKELSMIRQVDTPENLPVDLFDRICNNLVEVINSQTIRFSVLRELLYDILVYNIDISEAIWFILTHYIERGNLTTNQIKIIMDKMPTFLKQYHNNYRPIYHLENIFLLIIREINEE
jgi:hypothetical protein